MINYFRAELYRSLKSPSYKGSVFFLMLGSILYNFFLKFIMEGMEAPYSFQDGILSLNTFFSLPLIFIFIFISIVFIDDMKEKQISNVIASGLSRRSIVVGKILTVSTIGFLACIAIILIYLISGFLILPRASMIMILDAMKIMGLALFSALAIWFSAVAILAFLTIRHESQFMVGFSYYLIISLIPTLVSIVGRVAGIKFIVKIADTLALSSNLDIFIQNPSKEGLLRAFLLGSGYFIVFSILSIKAMEKRDF